MSPPWMWQSRESEVHSPTLGKGLNSIIILAFVTEDFSDIKIGLYFKE